MADSNHLQHTTGSEIVDRRTVDLALITPRTVAPTQERTVDVLQFALDCVSADLHEMARSTQQVFIDGTFADLAQELAEYLNIGAEIQPLLEENKKDDALKRLVTASTALNSSPEKSLQLPTISSSTSSSNLHQSTSSCRESARISRDRLHPLLSTAQVLPSAFLPPSSTFSNPIMRSDSMSSRQFCALLRAAACSRCCDHN